MSGYLPPGCSDSDCEPYDPCCGNCGCYFSAHYYTDGEEPKGDICSRDSSAEGIELNSKGEVMHACDSMIRKEQCGCDGFVEGEFEPDEPMYDWRDLD